MLLEDSKALLTEGGSGMEQLTFLAAVPTVMSLARVPSAVRHVDVAGEALTQAVTDNLRCVVFLRTAPAAASHPRPPAFCYCVCEVMASMCIETLYSVC